MPGELPLGSNRIAPASSAARRWYVLQTRARQEKMLGIELAGMNLRHCLPVVCEERHFGRRRAIVELPLFPGYVFLHGSELDLALACETRRVIRAQPVGQPSAMDDELESVARAIELGEPLNRFAFSADFHALEAGPL